jgi:hypothetical protein
MNPDIPESLEEQVRELTQRVWRLEDALQQRGIVVRKDQAQPAAEPASESNAQPKTQSWTAEIDRLARFRQAGAASPVGEPAHGSAPASEWGTGAPPAPPSFARWKAGSARIGSTASAFWPC